METKFEVQKTWDPTLEMMDVIILGAGVVGQMAKRLMIKAGLKTLVLENKSKLPVTPKASFFAHKEMKHITADEIQVMAFISTRHRFATKQTLRNMYALKVYNNIFEDVSIDTYSKRAWLLDASLFNYEAVELSQRIISINPIEQTLVYYNTATEMYYEGRYQNLITTIPQCTMASLVRPSGFIPKWHHGAYSFKPIYYYSQDLSYNLYKDAEYHPDVYTIAYHPDDDEDFYRRTIYKYKVTTESLHNSFIQGTEMVFPGKITIPRSIDPNFVVKTLRDLNIHMVGRYATWLPKYKIHDAYIYLKNLSFLLSQGVAK